MGEPVSTGLAVMADAVVNLPEPVKTSFFKAMSDLLGALTAIPAARLKQWQQGIEDTTAAKSMMSAVVAKAAADGVAKDPILVQAAAEVYLPTNLRKARNRLSVAQSAAERLAEEVPADAVGEGVAPPDEDWMNSFARFAEDASSERLQNLFGRILAGEIVRPGAFGLATLRAVSELDQVLANDFSLAWAKSVGGSIDYSSEWQRGEYFSRWKRLSDAGLMAPTEIAQYPATPNPDGTYFIPWVPIAAGSAAITAHVQQGATPRWTHIEFTRIGRELGSLLERPDYEANVRRAAQHFPRSGLARIEFHLVGAPAELVWQVGQ
jgi:hypothetical protein